MEPPLPSLPPPGMASTPPPPRPTEEQKSRLAHRKMIASEIMTSERSYVQSLQALQDKYILPLTQSKFLSSKEIASLFGEIQTILPINQALLKDLERIVNTWSAGSCIGDLFSKWCPYLNKYTAFVKGFDAMHQQLTSLKAKKSKFKDFIDKADAASVHGQLGSLLIMPIQRIPRYELLLKELLKYTEPYHPDHQHIGQAIPNVQAVAAQINTAVEENEEGQRVIALQKSLRGCPPLAQPGVKVHKAGVLSKHSLTNGKLKEYEFVLLTHKLLYAKQLDSSTQQEDTRGSYVGSKRRLVRIIQLDSSVFLDPLLPSDLSFRVITGEGPLTIFAKSLDIKQEWLQALQAVLEACHTNSGSSFCSAAEKNAAAKSAGNCFAVSVVANLVQDTSSPLRPVSLRYVEQKDCEEAVKAPVGYVKAGLWYAQREAAVQLQVAQLVLLNSSYNPQDKAYTTPHDYYFTAALLRYAHTDAKAPVRNKKGKFMSIGGNSNKPNLPIWKYRSETQKRSSSPYFDEEVAVCPLPNADWQSGGFHLKISVFIQSLAADECIGSVSVDISTLPLVPPAPDALDDTAAASATSTASQHHYPILPPTATLEPADHIYWVDQGSVVLDPSNSFCISDLTHLVLGRRSETLLNHPWIQSDDPGEFVTLIAKPADGFPSIVHLQCSCDDRARLVRFLKLVNKSAVVVQLGTPLPNNFFDFDVTTGQQASVGRGRTSTAIGSNSSSSSSSTTTNSPASRDRTGSSFFKRGFSMGRSRGVSAAPQREEEKKTAAAVAAVKEGYLNKAGAIVKKSRRRWFVLTPGKLSYYKDPYTKDVSGEIMLWGSTKINAMEGQREGGLFPFKIELNAGRTYCLAADTEKDRADWVSALAQQISSSSLPSAADDGASEQSGVAAVPVSSVASSGSNSITAQQTALIAQLTQQLTTQQKTIQKQAARIAQLEGELQQYRQGTTAPEEASYPATEAPKTQFLAPSLRADGSSGARSKPRARRHSVAIMNTQGQQGRHFSGVNRRRPSLLPSGVQAANTHTVELDFSPEMTTQIWNSLLPQPDATAVDISQCDQLCTDHSIRYNFEKKFGVVQGWEHMKKVKSVLPPGLQHAKKAMFISALNHVLKVNNVKVKATIMGNS